MNDNLVETEIKLYVPNLDRVRARLATVGAELEAARVFERNVRYDNQTGTLTGQGIVLRLREDSRVRLTYKERPTLIQDMVSRFEAEVTVDDFAVMDIILRKLGFVPFVVYEKYRTTYRFAGTEVVLDEMPYGNFVEIEGTVETIQAAVETLDLTNAPRIKLSYLALFTYLKAQLGLEMPDLSFAHFEGVEIGHDVFLGIG